MSSDLTTRARAIAEDHDAGAAELLQRLLSLLDEAVRSGASTTLDVSRIVCAGQPAMAPIWRACAAAVADSDAPGAYDRARHELARAPLALARAVSLALRDLLQDTPVPTVITLSYSSSLVRALLDAALPLRVVCGEGRPRFEGRRTAVTLADGGLDVTLATDAALTSYLDRGTSVIVGADAIASRFWINKVGTLGVVAAASRSGLPVYVVAGREKGLPDALAGRWRLSTGPPAEVWAEAPVQIAVSNPYFEAIPVELVTLFLTDAGPVSPDAAASLANRGAPQMVDLLTKLD